MAVTPETPETATSPRAAVVAAAVRRLCLRGGDGAERAAAVADAAGRLAAAEEGGSTCLPLDELGDGGACLRDSAAVAVRAGGNRAVTRERPLVLDEEGERLFTARSWFFQERLARSLAARLGEAPGPPPGFIEALFPEGVGGEAAAAVAGLAAARFGVLTGGPGTGKTTAAANLLAALLQAGEAEDPEGLSIAVATPTGKAAERIGASLRDRAPRLHAPPAVRERIAALRPTTIHALLGWTPKPPERGGPFRRTAANPIDADVVLVDEASMVGLELMARLVGAVRPDARLILMGDANQLASVEAGGVLAELVAAGGGVLAGRVFRLTRSYRFPPGGEVDTLANAVLAGDADAAVRALTTTPTPADDESADRPRLCRFSPTVRGLVSAVRACLDADAAAASSLGDAEALALRLSGVRVLTALRAGPAGEAGINQRLLDATAPGSRVDEPGSWPDGCPVLVTRNDAGLGLANGDLGLLEREPGGAAEVAFESADGPRRVPLALIPGARPGHAMTVHKAQGSEAHRVFVVLPDRDTPLLTRELLYTALTRVADRGGTPGTLQILGPEAVLRAAVRRRGLRRGGLAASLAAATRRR